MKGLTPSDIEEIVREYRSGVSCWELAERYGVSPPTVRYQLRREGVRLRSLAACNKLRAKKLDLNLLRSLVTEAQLSQREIAIRLDVALPVLERMLRRLHLKSKRGRGSPMEKNYFWKGGRCLDADALVKGFMVAEAR